MKKFLVLSAAVLMSGMVYAESVTCENENGKCVFEDDGSMTCECSDGETSGSSSTEPNDDEITLPTTEECLEWVEELCGIPEGAVTCENPAGNCVVYSDGSYYCQCFDGTGEGTGGSSEPGDPGVDGEEDDPSEPPVEVESDSKDGNDTTEPEMTCSDDSDCPMDYTCIKGICESLDDTPDVDPETCAQNLDCPEDYICVEGFCEFDGEIEMPVCEEVLVEACGTEAPDLKKICSEESLPYCVNSFSTLSEKCGEALPEKTVNELLAGTWNDHALEVADCCRGYEDQKTYYDDLAQCLETKSCEECMGQFEEATGGDDIDDVGDSGNTGDTGNTGDAGDTDDKGDTEASFEDDAADVSEGGNSSSGCSTVKI